MARQFPAVLVTGARQTGKTSLLRHLFPSASYVSLDLPAHADATSSAPAALLSGYPEPVIIDEGAYWISSSIAARPVRWLAEKEKAAC